MYSTDKNYETHDYWRAHQLKQRFGISQMALHRWLRDERVNFPRPIVISGFRYWKKADVLAWEQRCAANETAGPDSLGVLPGRGRKRQYSVGLAGRVP
jgi:predicted DNA-binding transcriptional regulator AlpA